ncbi:hypothetical protein BDP81DRAFT_104402 [Colletotrichum phormii]|uniref:Uncharacterized protein n=1 Tax=Colletotrichum phormii TaxID=359342 RepID=A0AAI9ZIS0_9PEZI|nr:uncharacterized protein BDP81DRAFT_104402 [Colletotrichum phormii]KAK1625003.1 hypothetical protein BDP81DRAFT_104402 [Colletotrichum phormii]
MAQKEVVVNHEPMVAGIPLSIEKEPKFGSSPRTVQSRKVRCARIRIGVIRRQIAYTFLGLIPTWWIPTKYRHCILQNRHCKDCIPRARQTSTNGSSGVTTEQSPESPSWAPLKQAVLEKRPPLQWIFVQSPVVLSSGVSFKLHDRLKFASSSEIPWRSMDTP